LISGRNPEFLIGKQVAAAPLLKKLGLQIIPTGYMLIGEASSASYMSNTHPIPYDKTAIAVATALAGEMLGHRVLYLDAGSGAAQPVPAAMTENNPTVLNDIAGAVKAFNSLNIHK